MSDSIVEPSLAPGATFGRYKIIKRLAVGGMAELFLAHPIGATDIVVLKKILPQYLAQSEFVDMFLDEARIASTLDHPNIVSLLDVGTVRDDYFFVMEFVLGHDLRTFLGSSIRKGQLPPLAVTVDIVASIASALHYAHEKRDVAGQPLELVHRDVTPDNIFISYDGIAKLGDFGIAKARGRLNETRGGQIKGKVMYMSPEQCIGAPLDGRSDVFSLGIILYELTTGYRLFDGETDFFILKKIVEEPIRKPTDLVPDYPFALERIVLTALAYEREHRYPHGQALADALARFAVEANYAPSVERTRGFVRWVFKHDLARYDAIVEAAESPIEVIDQFANMVDAFDTDGLLPIPTGSIDAAEAEARRAAAMRAIAAQRRVSEERRAAEERRVANEQAVASEQRAASPPRFETSPSPPSSPTAAQPISQPLPTVAAKFAESPSTARTARSASPWRQPAAQAAALALGLGILTVGGWSLLRAPSDAAIADVRPPPSAPSTPKPATTAPVVTPLPPEPVVDNKKPVPPVASTKPTKWKSAAATKATAASPTPAPAGEPGKLVLVVSPWAEVTIDGKPRGQTPLALELPPGKHAVQLRNQDRGLTRTLEITIEPGQTLRKKLDFE